MSKLLFLSFAALSMSILALFTSPPIKAQFGGGLPSYVQLQGSTPGTAQTGNLNVSGKAVAGSVDTLTLKVTGGAFNTAVLRSDSFGNASWGLDSVALPFTGIATANGAVMFIQNNSTGANSTGGAFINNGGGRGLSVRSNLGTSAVAATFEATGLGGVGLFSNATQFAGSFNALDAASVAVEGNGGALGGSFIARSDGGSGVKGVGLGLFTANGVWGDSQGGNGVLGTATSGAGVKGTSQTGDGIYGTSFDHTKAGVRGSSQAGVGVWGETNNTDSIGVYGKSGQGIGVKGESVGTAGVYGFSALHEGLYGKSQSATGVKGESTDGFAVYAESVTNYALNAKSTQKTAVYAESNESFGVHGKGIGAAGVKGQSNDYEGVIGESATNFGVRGEAVAGTGVKGFGGVVGVLGEGGLNGIGVHAKGGTIALKAESPVTALDVAAGTGGVGIRMQTEGDGGIIKVNSPMGQGLNVQTNGGNALVATSQSAICISGASVSNWGVHGHSETGIGVFGHAINGEGVWGTSDTMVGVRGRGHTTGVIGEGTTGFGVYGFTAEMTNHWAGYFAGNLKVTGSISKAGGTFTIDHPLDPYNRYLQHSFVESPDMMNIYNGIVKTDARGYARVTMPSWFQSLNRDFRYQLTVLDESDSATFALAKVVKKVKDNSFLIRSNVPNIEVSWTITGIRQDPYANAHRIEVEPLKDAKDRGFLLHAREYGQPAENSIDQRIRSGFRE